MIVSIKPILFRRYLAVGIRVCVSKSKCGQVTLLRAASMADQATACGQVANVNRIYFLVFPLLET